jgi:hypothetical protein
MLRSKNAFHCSGDSLHFQAEVDTRRTRPACHVVVQTVHEEIRMLDCQCTGLILKHPLSFRSVAAPRARVVSMIQFP